MNVRFSRSQTYWPVIWLLPVLILLVFLGDFTYARGADYSDIAITHFPNAVWIQKSLKEWGEIPLWSSTILSGYPFEANPLSGLLYPPGWIGLLFPEPGGLNFCIVLHLVLGGVGMYRFLRAEGAAHLPAVMGGIAFEAMPKMFGHVAAGHMTLVYAVAWTPWLLLAERQSQPVWKKDRAGWWKTALCFGLILLADLRWAALAGLLWVAYAVHLSIEDGQPLLRSFSTRVGKILVGLFFALCLGAALLLPLVEYTSLSSRALMTPEDSLSLSLPPAQLLGLLVPTIGGSAEWVLYPGAGILALALLGLGIPGARPKIGFWWILTSVALLFSLGSNLPGMDLLVRLPGFNMLRVPPRALFIAGFSLILAAVWTLQTLLDHPQSLREMGRLNPILLLVGLAAFILALAGLGWAVTGKFQAGFSLGGAALAGNLALIFMFRAQKLSDKRFAILLTAWLILDLGISNAAGMDFRAPGLVLAQGAQSAQFIKSQPGTFRVYSPSYSLPQQTAAQSGLQLVDGVDPLQLLVYTRFVEVASGVRGGGYSVTLPAFKNGEPASDNRYAQPDPKRLGLLNVGFVSADYDLYAPGLVEAARFGQTRVYRNQFVLPRAWVQDPGSKVGDNVLREARFQSTANQITVDAQGPGLLVLSEIAYPGWETWMDGNKINATSPIPLLRGIELPPGDHRLVMMFQPKLFQIGGIVSILGWLLVAGSWLIENRRYR